MFYKVLMCQHLKKKKLCLRKAKKKDKKAHRKHVTLEMEVQLSSQ